MERQSQALNERLLASQDRFHSEGRRAPTPAWPPPSAASLKDSLTESARVAGATFQPGGRRRDGRHRARNRRTARRRRRRRCSSSSTACRPASMPATGEVTGTWKAALGRPPPDQRRHGAAICARRSTGFSRGLRAALGRAGRGRVDAPRRPPSARVASHWHGALAQHERTSAQLAADTQQALTRAADSFVQQAAALLHSVDQAHAGLQTDIASRDAQRLAAWTQALEAMAAALRQEWQQAGEHTVREQRQLGETLTLAVREMSERTEAQAKRTIAESRAACCRPLPKRRGPPPKSSAELRQKLSDSMVRDNTMLEERTRLLDTLGTLLDAVNHASAEQRTAMDTLVASSAELLERVGSRFTDHIGAQAGKLADGGPRRSPAAPVEVASLGEAFGFAVRAVRRIERQAGRAPAAHRRRAGQVHHAQRRAAGLLRGAGARGDRPEHHVAEADRGRPAAGIAARQTAAGRSVMTRRAWMPTTAASQRPVPVWAVFGDLMSGLLGAFVLILVCVHRRAAGLGQQARSRGASSARSKRSACRRWNRRWPARSPPAASR